ncbi:pneumococcal-type histidine triad protein [Streptococcus chenjunshii]|uniref:Pneumococcal-type histidine triad protein n=1 Tax=Streptococcus chenjunshii TaxID=2173853 RepID=A0A372KMD4_9STRE|nr:pneumococcal-type histidine triad protein [Streptococcus chenjunshii]AXQ78184.1 pneumococcal-type histidine triad protein [Streptococcus chenjunshii]RFU50945.1 pneumococcal-type histidine triad protein [Streptococcus chenjunshii]RFU53442.1 pneumococcal-type histidine triad protein [Streptococcus chenjunshii]
MERSKKRLALVSLFLTAHLILGACQTNHESKQEPLSQDKAAKQKLKQAEEITVVAEIQEDGYVMVHGNHYHVEKKAIPYNAKFLSKTLAPSDYQLEKKDIVTKLEKGYIVKIDEDFYYYPTDKKHKANVISIKEARKLTKYLKIEEHHVKKNKKNKKRKNKKKRQIEGIDKPTNDGFLLTDESQITAKTDSGIIVEHNGHSHFFFYSDLVGSKWAYLIPKNYKQATSHEAASRTSSFQNGAHDHYVFSPSDIVVEDANGYIVRHEDHYHYILKSSLTGYFQARPAPHQTLRQTVAPILSPPQGRQTDYLFPLTNPLVSDGSIGQPIPPLPSQPMGGRSGIDYPTSDGFIFDGNGIVGRTEIGLLVEHQGHIHIVTYGSLKGTKWEGLIEKSPKPNQPSSESKKPELPPQTKPNQESDLEAKRAYLAKSLNLPLSSIRVADRDNGKVFIYPHGDHEHAIAVDKISLNAPIEVPHAQDNPHAHQTIGMATLKTLGFDDDIIEDILHAQADTDFPGQETDPDKMKEWLKTVKSLNIGERPNPLERKGLDLMPNIEILGIGFTPIKDIYPLYQFKKLKHLWLTKTGISNYDFLKNIPTLEGIDISQNNVSDLSFLRNYPQLKSVSAAGNHISDISVLASLNHLESLNLDYNHITDLSALRGLSKLQAVSLEHNQITNLSPLSGKKDLKRLFVSHNPEINLNTLKAQSLEELTVNHNELADLTFIKQLPSLKNLNAEHNKLRSLAGLEEALSLKNLSVANNQISDLGLLGEQTSLTTLNLTHNQLQNLEGINRFRILDDIDASHNLLSTLVLSQTNRSIRYLNVSHNRIPQEELDLNEHNIPKVIADYFKSAEGGDISGNAAAPSTAEAGEQAEASPKTANELEILEDTEASDTKDLQNVLETVQAESADTASQADAANPVPYEEQNREKTAATDAKAEENPEASQPKQEAEPASSDEREDKDSKKLSEKTTDNAADEKEQTS